MNEEYTTETPPNYSSRQRAVDKLPKDKEHYVIENMNLVHWILQKKFHMRPNESDYEDFYQEGCVGLILSAIRFDELKGFKFSTYACPMIIGNIQRYKRDKYYTVKIPRDKYNLLMNVIRYSSQGYSASDISQITGYSSEDIQHALSMSIMDSLDRQIIDDSNRSTSLLDVVADKVNRYEEALSEEHIFECIPVVTEMLKTELHRNIWEEYIWSMYYGEKLNQMYFATKYQCSQAQVSRILRECKKAFVKVLSQ